MKLEIKLSKNEAILSLKDNKKIIDKIEWEEKNNLSQTLLRMLDQMLKKHNLDKKTVKLSVKNDIPSGFTSTRIAQSVAKAFNFGNEKMKH